MIRSMTGYGTAERTTKEARIGVEIRTVNNRSLKISQRTPEGLGAAEAEIERLLRERLSRGTVFVRLAVEPVGAAARAPLNHEVLLAYWKDLAEVRKRLGAADEPPKIESLLALPGVVGDEAVLLTGIRDLAEIVREVTVEALDRLDAMREAEGEATARDMAAHLDDLERHVAAIRERAPGVIEEYHQRLRERASALAKGVEIALDDTSLAREVAFFAERADINEELARLASHLEQTRALLGASEPVGRRLEFLTQEMVRETNTIGSKSSDADIARQVVELKVGVDRLREQSQNIE
ncbi:MAG: YicC/YloC family endoribonuclease [Phycisphaerae bacterium]|nr:YicC/YloC family endoribonuclease [Phycisphaerae bacterium]